MTEARKRSLAQNARQPTVEKKEPLVNRPLPKIGLSFAQIWASAYLSPVIVKEIIPVRSAERFGNLDGSRNANLTFARRMPFVENCVENQSRGGVKRRRLPQSLLRRQLGGEVRPVA